MTRYMLTLDLKDDPDLIAEYELWHQNIWPEIKKSIKDAGVETMSIYRYQTRLCMLMDVNDNFSFEKKAKMDSDNPIVQKWENLMLKYQQPFLLAEGTGKWQVMKEIFDLN